MKDTRLLSSPPAEPVFGHLRLFTRAPLEFLDTCAREHGDIVRLRFLHRTVYLLNHPRDVEQVLIADHRKSDKTSQAGVIGLTFGRGVFTSRGAAWRQQRRALAPAWSRGAVRRLSAGIVEETTSVMSGWRDGITIELCREMSRLSLRIIGRSLFGFPCDAELRAIKSAGEIVFERFRQEFPVYQSPVYLLPHWIPVAPNVRLRRAIHELRRLCQDLLTRARERRADDRDAPDSMLGSIVASAHAEVPGESIDQLVTLLLTGQDTVAAALAWTGWFLASQPEVRTRLEDEARNVGDRLEPDRLPWARCVVLESLRLRPPAWGMNRQFTDETVLASGLRLHRGAVVAASQWVIHRDARFFADPLSFRPERWMDGSLDRLPAGTYFPFGAGPRMCLGRHFALQELVLILASLARQFRLNLMAPVDPAPRLSITMHPNGPIPVQLESVDRRVRWYRAQTPATMAERFDALRCARGGGSDA